MIKTLDDATAMAADLSIFSHDTISFCPLGLKVGIFTFFDVQNCRSRICRGLRPNLQSWLQTWTHIRKELIHILKAGWHGGTQNSRNKMRTWCLSWKREEASPRKGCLLEQSFVNANTTLYSLVKCRNALGNLAIKTRGNDAYGKTRDLALFQNRQLYTVLHKT